MSPKMGRWVRLFVDYAGLAAFLVTMLVVRDPDPNRAPILASWAVVGGSLAALAVGLALERRLAPIPLVTAIFGVIFGGATIYFHDPRIIKMKLTILDAALGAFLVTGALRGKNPLKALMGEAFHLPDPVVRTLTLRYALFFFALAAANEVIWRTQSNRVWALYKFPGTAVLIFLFAMSQAPLMMKHMPDDEPAKDETP
ncbi:inner membrane-spanning protein YciB [Phenylobacterium sp.]|uniref:inner membrane-spanning protein YciB n=1 Tax=Phenylobacterium sp. TaxID=1871053 RepID=UPI002DEAA9CD|nr:septation protein IspZ [Phenylobacterium sp.]